MKLGAAYLAGARFDVALDELKKGRIFPKVDPGSNDAEQLIHKHDHGEL